MQPGDKELRPTFIWAKLLPHARKFQYLSRFLLIFYFHFAIIIHNQLFCKNTVLVTWANGGWWRYIACHSLPESLKFHLRKLLNSHGKPMCVLLVCDCMSPRLFDYCGTTASFDFVHFSERTFKLLKHCGHADFKYIISHSRVSKTINITRKPCGHPGVTWLLVVWRELGQLYT